VPQLNLVMQQQFGDCILALHTQHANRQWAVDIEVHSGSQPQSDKAAVPIQTIRTPNDNLIHHTSWKLLVESYNPAYSFKVDNADAQLGQQPYS